VSAAFRAMNRFMARRANRLASGKPPKMKKRMFRPEIVCVGTSLQDAIWICSCASARHSETGHEQGRPMEYAG